MTPARATRLRVGPGELALALGVVALGAALVAWGAGWLAPSKPAGPPPGTVAVPAAAVRIPAYAQVTLDHLVRPGTGDLAVVYLPADSILPTTITRAEDVLGRVLAGEKAPGLLFTRGDFLPDGTRPGLVAGIPPGKRAMRVDAAQVNGLAGLLTGDRFDLVATAKPTGPGGGAGVTPSGVRARARVLVEDGAVVMPLESRALPNARGPGVVQEMVLAVEPAEVPLLTEALASGARIDCIPRSGQPASEAGAPGDRPPRTSNGVRSVERITGTRREWVDVPEPAAHAPDLAPRPLVSAVPPAAPAPVR